MQKGLLTILAITLLAGTTLLNTQDNNSSNFLEEHLMKEYQNWQSTHGKKYSNSESTLRFGIFKKNYAYVQEHMKRVEQGLESFELGLNQFADLSIEEFEAKYLKMRPSSQQSFESFEATGRQVPESVDLRNEGLVSPVKNQGSCGSCWAFSAVAALETALRQGGKKDVELSEQELVDCARGTPYESEGCDGGEMFDGFKYATTSGIAVRSEYPYAGVDQACKASSTKTRYQFNGYVDVASQNAQAFVEAAAEHALSVGINASGVNFQLYTKGIYNKACDGDVKKLNHGVTVVGYASDYYLVKNSWGTSWGESGYIRFARIANPVGQCGIQQEVTYPVYKKNVEAIFE